MDVRCFFGRSSFPCLFGISGDARHEYSYGWSSTAGCDGIDPLSVGSWNDENSYHFMTSIGFATWKWEDLSHILIDKKIPRIFKGATGVVESVCRALKLFCSDPFSVVLWCLKWWGDTTSQPHPTVRWGVGEPRFLFSPEMVGVYWLFRLGVD